jgi:hypothetical protein
VEAAEAGEGGSSGEITGWSFFTVTLWTPVKAE